VSDQELLNLYNSADIFVLPSRYEGYPITLLEAMVSGLPCIASDISSNCDIMTNERDGLFFKVDDFVDLSRKLYRLLVDDRLRGVFSRNAKRKAKQFDWKKIAQDTVAVYEKVAVQAKR
jgi:glycosyltransferase involved in cell wall biosynthesis